MKATEAPTPEKPTIVTQRLGNLDLTHLENLPEAIFRQKLQVLDLLVERMSTSGNPRFVVQYTALLREVELILTAILQAAGAPVSPYLTQVSESPAPSGKRSVTPQEAPEATGNKGRTSVQEDTPPTPKPVRGMALPPLITEILVKQSDTVPISAPLGLLKPTRLRTGSGNSFNPYLQLPVSTGYTTQRNRI
jgi:hypothetical protein